MTRLAILLLGVMLAIAHSADSLRTMDGSANVTWTTMPPQDGRLGYASVTSAGLRDSVRTGTAPNRGWIAHDTLIMGDIPIDPLVSPQITTLRTSRAKLGAWAITFHTKRHGAVDLDDLLDRIDSVLAGEHRK